jgi:hypothetical protein
MGLRLGIFIALGLDKLVELGLDSLELLLRLRRVLGIIRLGLLACGRGTACRGANVRLNVGNRLGFGLTFRYAGELLLVRALGLVSRGTTGVETL